MGFIFEVISSFIYGITLPVRSIRLIIRRKSLFTLSFFPILLSIGVSIWGVSALTAYLKGLGMNLLAQYGYSEGTITASAASILFTVVMWILAAIVFSMVAGVIASPFNDLLAESTEKETSLLPVPKSDRPFMNQLKLIRIDIIKTLVVTSTQFFFLFMGLLFFWVPVLNVLLAIITIWLMTFQFISYPQTRRGLGLMESIRFIRSHPFAALGFGLVTGSFFALPLLSVFALPTAVVGGTLLYARSLEEEKKLR